MFLLVLELCLSDASPVSSPTRMEPLELQRQLFSVGDLFQTDVHALIRNGNGEPRFRLAYLPCRNRCEIPRLILEEAGCCYDMEVIGFQTWKASVKPLAPYGKLPCLVSEPRASASVSDGVRCEVRENEGVSVRRMRTKVCEDVTEHARGERARAFAHKRPAREGTATRHGRA